jgi:6-phosphogluconate dehydrogenase
MNASKYKIGMIGLGVMGSNLALNILDHGFSVAAYNRHADKTLQLEREAQGKALLGARTLEALVEALEQPRAIMLMVPAGPPVDQVISELTPLLTRNDLLIDGGNSYYKDTDVRMKSLGDKGIQFMGVGISGGEKGARLGPSIMPGGLKESYGRVKQIFEAVAADANGDPCVAYLGSGSAGHYVKMVHNGIEYGLMQLISEAYDLLKRGLELNNNEIADIFLQWNRGELKSFLIEITSEIFMRYDDRTGGRLIDQILDKAQQKGTGKWASQDALDLQVPIPTIDVAVAFRDLSIYKDQRSEASKLLCGATPNFSGDKRALIEMLHNALQACVIITYAQGMALLKAASREYSYGLNLADVARVWREGCIIRAKVLDDIVTAFNKHPVLTNLMMDVEISKTIVHKQIDLRRMIQSAVAWGIPVPGMMASISYFDGFRSERLPANLIQAQRDYFGAHTYQRVDETGSHHTNWEEP